MKKHLLLLVIAVSFSGCSNEQKAKKAVKDYLSRSLHDFSSYEPVEFKEVDSSFTLYIRDPKYIAIATKQDLFAEKFKAESEEFEKIRSSYGITRKNFKTTRKEMDISMKKSKVYLDSITSLANQGKRFAENFKPEFNGHIIAHTYRSKNKLGAKVLEGYYFIVDPTYTKVIDVIEPDKYKPSNNDKVD